MTMKKLNAKGVSLVELMIASAILAVMTTTVIQTRYFMAKQTERNSEKAFATEKAIQMEEELRAIVNNNSSNVTILDAYADSVTLNGTVPVTVFNPVLTTDQSVTSPLDSLSGNTAIGSGWKYYRYISVAPAPNDPKVRTVSVHVYVGTKDKGLAQGDEFSHVTTVLRTISKIYQPTQVLDVYILALNNVLGWFTTVPAMQSIFDSAISDLELRNDNALQFRTHYIIQTGFGRDPYYKPYINDVQNPLGTPTTIFADQTAMPYVYFYPGRLHDAGTTVSDQFFADQEDTGLTAVGNVLDNDSAAGTIEAVTTFGHAMADMYNNCERYPDEVADYQAVSTAAVNSGVSPPEVTLRMLLEEMASSPQSFTNAIIVSMHGEVVPIPAMRNYSDAAKDPLNNPNVRVVTHPDRIYYPAGAPASINLRVYGYYDGLEKPTTLTSMNGYASTVAIWLPDLQLTTSDVKVTAIAGGATLATHTAADVGYAATVLASGTSVISSMGYPMSWSMASGSVSGSGGTTIYLYNTPLRCPQYTTTATLRGTGLPTAYQLYNLEYIPCPPTDSATLTSTSQGTSFTPDLTSAVTAAKNTARWIISLNNSGSKITSGTHTIETFIGSQSYAVTSCAEDISKTYCWVSIAPPFTERYQFNGDPRDCPYYDVKCGYYPASGDTVTIDADGYNWYFKNLGNNGSGGSTDTYNGFDMATTCYQGGTPPSDIRDMPRYYYLYRTALLNTGSIYDNLNGWSFWHAAQGGEFGDTYAPWPNSLPLMDLPWNPRESAATQVYVSEVQNQGTYSGVMAIARDGGSGAAPISFWYSKWWMGELYPDDTYASWAALGNLPTGKNNFYRVPLGSVTMMSGLNTMNGFASKFYGRDVGGRGPADFIFGLSGGTTIGASAVGFMHTSSAGSAPATQVGLNLFGISNFPLANPVSVIRPWGISVGLTGSGAPDEWGSPFYKTKLTKVSIPSNGTTLDLAYGYSTGTYPNGVGVVKMGYVNTAGTTQTAYYDVSGLAPQANFPTLDLAETGIIMAMRNFLDAGLFTGSDHIVQLPLIEITNPQPAQQLSGAVSITWGAVPGLSNMWNRWGNTSYTEQYPVTWTEPTNPTIIYNVKYMSGTGSWQFVQDGATATFGVPDFAAAHAVTVTNYNFNVSALASGPIYLLVEAYRENSTTSAPYYLHYAYHEVYCYVP
jgi:hypothetical protein